MTNKIGAFCNKEMVLGGIMDDGPPLGPFSTIKKYIIGHLQWTIQRIETDEQLQSAKHLILSLQNIIDRARTDRNLSNLEIKLQFTHADLNSSNILVNENTGEVLAILDWEKSVIRFRRDDVEFYSGWFDNDQREKEF